MTIDIPKPDVEPEEMSFAQVMEASQLEYDQTQKEIKEIALLLQQSTSEVEKLAQRNAQISNKKQMMENTLDSLPRQDIVEIYKTAQDSQNRLFMMRGQVEQLQSKQNFLDRYGNQLKEILSAYSDDPNGGAGGGNSGGGGGAGGSDATNNQIMNIINAQENERLHLSMELHDGPAQSLTNLILQAEICERLFDQNPDRARTELGSLKESVNNTFKKIREYIFELRPDDSRRFGLDPHLKTAYPRL